MLIRAVFSAGLLAAGAAASAQPVATVPITVTSFHIAPGAIHLVAGRPVRLVFTNASGAGHDFTAPAFFARASGVAGPVDHGEVELGGHQSATITLTPARGTYKAKCSHFGHKLLGMSATIVVD